MVVVASAGHVGWMCHGAAAEKGEGIALAFVWAGQAQPQPRWHCTALVSCTQLPACLALWPLSSCLAGHCSLALTGPHLAVAAYLLPLMQ
jgi:hypothetical protein